MVKEQSLSVLIKKADEVFSEFIRLRASDESSIARCFICGTPRHWKYHQCGHWIDRDQMATRFDEVNCQCVCHTCNCLDRDHADRFEGALIKNYGQFMVASIKRQSKSLAKFTRSDIQWLINDYKYKVKELRKQKHL